MQNYQKNNLTVKNFVVQQKISTFAARKNSKIL